MDDHFNLVDLLEVNGSDLSIARAAWHSTGKGVEGREDEIPGLLQRLWNAQPNRHESPFRFASLVFQVHGDIATHIHFLKHRVGVEINTRSARYAELKDDAFYLPPELAGSPLELEMEQHTLRAFEKYHEAIKELQPKIGRQRAKEVARYFLPYNIQLDWVVQFSLPAFHHFYELRGRGAGAQKEITDLAEEMRDMVCEVGQLQHTVRAWGWVK